MLLEFSQMTENEMYRMVQDVYREGSVENARWRYPQRDDLTEAIEEEERNFVSFLRTFFQNNANRYYVLELDGQWVSALRLTRIDDFYYLEALETAEVHRRKGYAEVLFHEVVRLLNRRGQVVIRDNVSKRNLPSLAIHKKCGFVIEEENGTDRLSGETSDRVYGMIYTG